MGFDSYKSKETVDCLVLYNEKIRLGVFNIQGVYYCGYVK